MRYPVSLYVIAAAVLAGIKPIGCVTFSRSHCHQTEVEVTCSVPEMSRFHFTMMSLFSVILAAQAQPIDMTTSYERQVKESKYTIVKFFSPSCKACIAMKPIFDEVV